MNEPSVKQILSSLDIRPAKKMGQNFLCNDEIAQRITDLVPYNTTDVIVEIGPGMGALTKHLVQHDAHVIAIELDKRLCEYLRRQYTKIPGFQLINDDVLRIDWENLLHNYKHPVIMSNLPYSISSQVVIHFLKQNICKEFYCMLQKEMTERLCGTANTKQYNAFSALSQHYTKFESCLEVAPHNFYPQPQVDSIVIKLVRNDSVFEPHYEQFLKHCFQSRRQTLINNLKHFYDITVVAKWLTLNQYPLKVRSEAIQESKLYALYQELYHG